jgi:hypothetical protein
MKRAECSREAPWGIHETLRELECPRCGWAPNRDELADGPPLPVAPERVGWTLVAGGLPAAAAA